MSRNNEFVAGELLTRLHENEPAFFEQAVLDLLMAMGYGGTQGKATRTQLSNDGGIDGIIDQDALGLSRIYVQAKRYGLDKSIGRPDIQGFVGALQGGAGGPWGVSDYGEVLCKCARICGCGGLTCRLD